MIIIHVFSNNIHSHYNEFLHSCHHDCVSHWLLLDQVWSLSDKQCLILTCNLWAASCDEGRLECDFYSTFSSMFLWMLLLFSNIATYCILYCINRQTSYLSALCWSGCYVVTKLLLLVLLSSVYVCAMVRVIAQWFIYTHMALWLNLYVRWTVHCNG